ncbi:MAG: tetratricopeptide repeat protein [Planctomycetota bacterium]
MDWTRIEDLFHRTLERPVAERASFLSSEAADDADLSREVKALLDAHEDVDDEYMVGGPPTTPETEIAGFQLVSVLGEGGMGVVYEARQEQPSRTVALKVTRALPNREGDLRRFEFEAEVMGRLRHPHIAQVHAAGAEPDAAGTLAWFALELVPDATDIRTYCERHGLDDGARLQLFDDVLAAIEYGHAQGVLHRDLKPSNLLVGSDGLVKVIDFGIASAAVAAGAELTLPGQLIGTLAYMSPEQAGGGADASGPRGDVYALGVVLYELLAGARPRDLSDLSTTGALETLRRDPVVPVATHRPDLPVDLQIIVAKALAQSADDRYDTVAALREDIGRFRSRRPILARPPGAWRRATLFVRRHPVGVAASAIVAASLLVSTVVSIAFALDARRAASDERDARQHAERISGFHEGLLAAVRPSIALGRDVTVRELLDDAVHAAERDLGDEPSSLASILSTLGTSYSMLGDATRARALLERSIELLEGQDRAADAAIATSDLGRVAAQEGRHERALELFESALAVLEESDRAGTYFHGVTLRRISFSQRQSGDSESAMATAKRALTLPAAQTNARLRAELLINLGQIHELENDGEAAVQHLGEALELLTATLPPRHPDIALAQNNLASAEFRLGRVEDARVHWEAARDIFAVVLDPEHPDRVTVAGNLALVYERGGDFERADELLLEVIELRRASPGDRPRLAFSIERRGWLLTNRGDPEQGLACFEEAVAIQRSVLDEAPADKALQVGLADRLQSLGLGYRSAKRFDDAGAAIEEAIGIQGGIYAEEHPKIATSTTILGLVRLESGDLTAARTLLERALAIRRKALPAGHWQTANTAGVLGECLTRLGDHGTAEPLLVEAVDGTRRTLGDGDFRTRENLARLVALYEAWGRPDDAGPWRAVLGPGNGRGN